MAGDRRSGGSSVRWDAASRVLTVGGEAVVLAGLHDNEAVLRSYLELVLAQRGVAPGQEISLRDDDVEALSQLLDLDDAHLESRLVRLLSVSSPEATELHGRLRRRALRSAAAAVGVGALAMIPAARARGDGAGPEPVAAVGPATAAGPSASVAESRLAPDTAASTIAVGRPDPAVATPATDIGDAVWYVKQPDGSVHMYTESAPVPPADDGTDIGTALTIEVIPPPSGG